MNGDGALDIVTGNQNSETVTVLLAYKPKIQNPDNGHWYQRFDNAMTWHDAKDYCENMGGYLQLSLRR